MEGCLGVQVSIQNLAGLGRLPSADEVSPSFLEKFQGLLSAIQRPVTDQEAETLAGLLGPDDCHGLAWTLVHIIEEASGWPLSEAISKANGEWAEVLAARAK
jgi:hypothetical protein